MKNSLIISIVLHSIILTIAILGLPELLRKNNKQEGLNVAIIDYNDLKDENINEEKEKLKEKVEIKEIKSEEKKPIEVEQNIETKKKKPEEKKSKNKETSEFMNIEPPIKLSKPAAPKRQEIKPKIENEFIAKKEEKLKTENFDDMLKDLSEKKLESNEKNINKTNNKEKLKERIKELAGSKLENSETLLAEPGERSRLEKIIIEQVDENWSRPPGLKITEDVNVKIVINLNRDGSLNNFKIDDNIINKARKNSSYRPYVEYAIRAVKKASPFKGLDQNRYFLWKSIAINFRPLEGN